MKELTIEQKAKAYDEALAKIRKGIQPLQDGSKVSGVTKGFLEEVFPELKESEDERIRMSLIELFKDMEWDDSILHDYNMDKDKTIAWLEKQDIFSKKDIDDAYLKGVRDTKNEIEKQYEANYQIRKDIATFIFNYKGDIKDRAKWMNYLGIKVSFVEKQGKQKETLCDKCRKEQPSHSCQDITALGRCALEKQGEQKPQGKSAWSEEDERICQCLIKDQEESLDNVRNDRYGHSEIISDLKEMYAERIAWLKSLKDRIEE